MPTTSITSLTLAASLFVSPVAAAAAGTAAGQPAASAAPAAKNTAAADEKKICKQLPSSTSRLPERVCLTAAQWKQVDAGDQ